MFWIIIGIVIAIVVAINLTQWPRKKLARLAELAVADFERRTYTADEVERAKERVRKRAARASRVDRWDWREGRYERIEN